MSTLHDLANAAVAVTPPALPASPSAGGIRRAAVVYRECNACSKRFLPIRKDQPTWFSGSDWACSTECAATSSRTQESTASPDPPTARAVANVLRRKASHYAALNVPTIMAARVPAAIIGHPDSVIVASPDPDLTTIMKYFLLQGAVGDESTCRLMNVAAKAVAMGKGDAFFRYAANFLDDKGHGKKRMRGMPYDAMFSRAILPRSCVDRSYQQGCD